MDRKSHIDIFSDNAQPILLVWGKNIYIHMFDV